MLGLHSYMDDRERLCYLCYTVRDCDINILLNVSVCMYSKPACVVCDLEV